METSNTHFRVSVWRSSKSWIDQDCFVGYYATKQEAEKVAKEIRTKAKHNFPVVVTKVTKTDLVVNNNAFIGLWLS